MGGVDFEQLCQGGIRNYSFNLADIRSEEEVKQIKRKLVNQLESTARELEFHSDRTISKLYIGKTFIQRRRKPGGGFMIFNPLKHHTWRKNGISSRWGSHKHEDYGRDGLVVLGAITKQTVPKKCRDRVHQEDFTLALEQKLLHHYLLSHPDSRVVNATFTAGRPPERNYYAYAVYMAFSYTDDDDGTATDNESEEFINEGELQQEIPPSPQPPAGDDDSYLIPLTIHVNTSQTATDAVQRTQSDCTLSKLLSAGPTIQPNDQAPPLPLSSLVGINFLSHPPPPPLTSPKFKKKKITLALSPSPSPTLLPPKSKKTKLTLALPPPSGLPPPPIHNPLAPTSPQPKHKKRKLTLAHAHNTKTIPTYFPKLQTTSKPTK